MARLMNPDGREMYSRPGRPGPGERGRAMLILGGVGVLLLGLIIAVIMSLTGMFAGSEATGTQPSADPMLSSPGLGPSAGSGPQAEAALAQAPMLQLPVSAVSPRTLSTRSAGPPIALPQPEQVTGALVPTGFPATEAGALAQLVELMRVGMADADPQTWARAYDSLAEPGALPAAQTRTSQDLVDLRRGSNMNPTGPLRSGMRISWAPTSVMVKGTTDDRSYTVACALGELVADNDGRVVSFGWGNCLPMRRVGDQWRIASGPTAATAPSAWPGSEEAVSAGWRDITR